MRHAGGNGADAAAEAELAQAPARRIPSAREPLRRVPETEAVRLGRLDRERHVALRGEARKMLVIWNERASPSRARAAVASAVMSRPSKRIAPVSGASSPVIWPIKVVLPAPLGPIRACTSPRRTSSEISSHALSAPKLLLTPRISSTGSVIVLMPRRQDAPQSASRREFQADDGGAGSSPM